MRESEERFRLLVENVTDYAIYMLDPQGRITSWNMGTPLLLLDLFGLCGWLVGYVLCVHESKFG